MPDDFLRRYVQWGIEVLLQQHPDLRLRPSNEDVVVLAGTVAFSAQKPGFERIDDAFEVEIKVPNQFPQEFPHVWETGNRIPATYHKLQNGSLCLGSPARIRLAIKQSPTLVAFVQFCVIPYLYGFAFQERFQTLPFGELSHGMAGLREDYAELFGVKGEKLAVEMVRLASLNKRDANRRPCPCGSGKRVGKCHNRRVNEMRELLGRKWLADEFHRLSRIR